MSQLGTKAQVRAGKYLGLGQKGVKRKAVVKAVAKATGLKPPQGRRGQYQFLIDFCQSKGISLDQNPTASDHPKYADVNCDAFLKSIEWRRVRMVALKANKGRCECCGASPKDGIVLHVDHIKPRRLFPQLALDPDNLQVLCEVCNHGKGNWDQTDWRGPEPVQSQPKVAQPRLVKRQDISDTDMSVEDASRIWTQAG